MRAVEICLFFLIFLPARRVLALQHVSNNRKSHRGGGVVAPTPCAAALTLHAMPASEHETSSPRRMTKRKSTFSISRLKQRDDSRLVEAEAPLDVHYLIASMCLAKDATAWTGIISLVAGYILVLLQGFVAIALCQTLGNRLGPCVDTEDCGLGMWCSDGPWRGSSNYDPRTRIGIGVGTCRPCHGPKPLNVDILCHEDGTSTVNNYTNFTLGLEVGTYPLFDDDAELRAFFIRDMSEDDIAIMCDECVQDGRGITAPPLQINMRVLGPYQYLVLVLVAIVAAGTVANESRARAKTILFCIHHSWDDYPHWKPPADQPPPAESTSSTNPSIKPDASGGEGDASGILYPSAITADVPTLIIPDVASSTFEQSPTLHAVGASSEFDVLRAEIHRLNERLVKLEKGGRHATADSTTNADARLRKQPSMTPSSPGGGATDMPPPLHWRVKHRAVLLLQVIRAMSTVFIVSTVSIFVLRDLSIPSELILNTLSVLFVLEVDDLACNFFSTNLIEAVNDVPMYLEERHTRSIDHVVTADMAFALLGILAVPIAALLPDDSITSLPLYYYLVVVISLLPACATEGVLRNTEMAFEKRMFWSSLSDADRKARKKHHSRRRLFFETTLGAVIFVCFLVVNQGLPLLFGEGDYYVFGPYSGVG